MIAPSPDFFARVAQLPKPVEAQAFVSELAVESLNKSVLHKLAWLNKPQTHAGQLGQVGLLP